jgi:hypothetical protein
MNRKSSTPTIINTAEITTVLKNTPMTTTNNFLAFLISRNGGSNSEENQRNNCRKK